MVLDFRRLKPFAHHPININDESVEIMQILKYAGVHISQNLTWGTPEASPPEVREEGRASTTAAGELLQVSH